MLVETNKNKESEIVFFKPVSVNTKRAEVVKQAYVERAPKEIKPGILHISKAKQFAGISGLF